MTAEREAGLVPAGRRMARHRRRSPATSGARPWPRTGNASPQRCSTRCPNPGHRRIRRRSLMPSRISLSIDTDESPAWSPDGSRVAWVQAAAPVMVRGAGAVLLAEVMARFDDVVRVSLRQWTADGAYLVVSRTSPTRTRTCGSCRSAEAGAPRGGVNAVLGCGGCDVAGRTVDRLCVRRIREFEAYVEAIHDRSPGPGTRERVSSGGGSDPRWSRTGQELFFRRGSRDYRGGAAPPPRAPPPRPRTPGPDGGTPADVALAQVAPRRPPGEQVVVVGVERPAHVDQAARKQPSTGPRSSGRCRSDWACAPSGARRAPRARRSGRRTRPRPPRRAASAAQLRARLRKRSFASKSLPPLGT